MQRCTNAYKKLKRQISSIKKPPAVSLGQDRRAFLAGYSAVKLYVGVKFSNLRKNWPISKLKGETAAVAVASATALL